MNKRHLSALSNDCFFQIGKQEAKYNIYGYFIESFAIKDSDILKAI